METDTDSEVEDRIYPAKTVYLLMKKDYRISRNIRASWFFNHLNTVLEFNPKSEKTEPVEELSVLSVVPEQDDTSDGEMPPLTPNDGFRFQVLPTSVVTFLAKTYRLVFVLDMSPSAASVDLKSGTVLVDQLHQALKCCISGLVKPFILPGAFVELIPDLYVTVIAYTPVLTCTSNQVLAQGIKVDESNVTEFLHGIENKLNEFEQVLATGFGRNSFLSTFNEDDQYTDEDSMRSNKTKENNADAGIINLLRQGFFALQLLPENSSAGIVVVTDGMLGVTDNNLFDSLMTQLRNSTIACSFLKTGDTYCSRCQFGHIPHVELLQFIATATFGAYFSSCPDLSQHNGKQLNVYHKALLLWSFQKGLEGFKYELTHHRTVDSMHPISLINRILSHPIKDKSTVVMPIVHKKHLETKLNTSIHSVLSVRLREGYTIKDVLISKSGSQLEVRLVLPWRDYAKIEYKAVSSWPVDPTKKMTNVEITIEGSYDFLHDITCPQSKMNWSSIRTANVKKFWITLQRLSQTDQLLVHLQSFGSNPIQFNVPNSVTSGVPVFYQPQSSTTPALNTQHSSKDMELNLFSSFWKPVVNLDIKIWQKWMHSHRIGMVLEHDIPLPKYLHTPNSSGRFSMISCRQALTSLSFLLRDWSSFVLIEGSSYIKFLYRDTDKPPVSFLLLRVTSKPPCMVLRLAFLGGTSGSMRHKTLQMLKNKVRELKFPQRGSQQISKNKQTGIKQGKQKPVQVVKKPPLQREWSEIGCCVLLTKPVGDILISYENKPRDMTILEDPSRYIPIHITMQQASSKSTMANAFNSLSRYLHHQRWIWTVKQGKVDITLQAIGRILSTLAKIRLQEGFHFASSNAGIVNMVLEVEMVDLSRPQNELKEPRKCVVQYVMFPPHIKTTRDSVSEEDLDEMETTEADGELQIVTECWIEPQHGTSINNSPERQHWDGLTYKDIAKAFYPKDVECISCLVTFEHLVYVCQNSAIFTSDLTWLLDSCVNNDGFKTLYQDMDSTKQQTSASPNIYQMSFPFDLLSLIPKSQQAELLFSTYFLYPEDFQRNGKGSNRLLFSLLFEKLKDGSQREVTLSLEDCEQFLSLLKARPRNNTTRRLPFPTEKTVKTVIESETDIKTDVEDSSKPVHEKPQRQSSGDSVRDLIPKWRCFVRAASNTRLYLTFLPASFDDLLVLNQISISDKFNDRTIEHEISIGNSQDNCKCSTSNQPEDTEGQKVTVDQTANQIEVPEDEKMAAIKVSEELPECDNEMSEETTRKEESDDDKKTKESKLSVSIPIYVYECFLGNVTDSLINPWSFQLSPDIYEDVTFDVENEESNNIMFKIPTLDKEGTPVSEEKEDSFYSAQGLRMSHERRSDSSIDGGGDLRQQCTFLTDTYYICFVNGVFQSLQQGFFVDQHDVDAAINNICEELLPIETDITTFLFTSCRHFQHLVDISKHDIIAKEVEEASKDDLTPRRHSVRFMDIVEDNEGESYNKLTPSVLQLPQSTVKLQTSISQTCEYLPGLHSLIQNKFMDIIQKWFRVVPTNPDYFFYCPDILPQDNSIEAVDTDDKQSNNYVTFDITHGEGTEDVEELILPENYDLLEEKKAVDLDITSTASVMDSQDSFIDSDEYDHCEDVTEDGNDQQPLFVHFTCTVKSRLDNINVTVQKLLPCLDEILKSVKLVPDFNLGDLKITFDFNCLNLASDDEPETPSKPHFVRMMSNSSVSTSPTNEAESFQYDGASSSETPGPLRQLHGDPIGHLPVLQHNAVMKCKEELEWLFKDEITSALRHMQPIREDALQFVINHVKYSVDRGKPNCCTDNIPLHFVYGAEHSLSRFEEELERINLRSFRFLKEEKIYYIIKGKCHNLANHAKKLNNALVELSREGTPAKPCNNMHDSVDDGVTSHHADVPLTTYVSPAFISPTYNARDSSLDGSGSHVVISSDLSGPEASPSNYLFHKENMRMSSDKLSSGTESDSKDVQKKSSLDIDIRRHSEPNENVIEGKLPLPVKSVELRSESLSDDVSEGTLKKSSSFAGFTSEENTEAFKRQESMTALSTSPIKGVTNVPQLPSLGRLRHFSAPSGQGTPHSKTSTLPQTPSWISSRGSYTEEGYDGDSSDSEEGATSFNDTTCLQQSLPNFWLILKVKEDAVDVYYHYRETGQEENEEKREQRLLLTLVKGSLEDLCRRVNQVLLMNDLYDTRMCKKLLVAEADEDVSWNVDRSVIPGRTPVSEFSSEEEDDQATEKPYLAADIHHAPGYFDCECVFRQTFGVHSRLKTSGSQRRSNVSPGVQVLRQVLNKFSVNNRKNMFVIKEMAGNMAVFYVKLKEIVNTSLSRQVSSISTENINLNESSSSLVFHLRKDEQVLDKDSDTVSVCSAGSSTPLPQQDTIELAVHGIQEPGSEIKEDLMRLLQHKLDDAVLDIIALQLSRNPNSKLLSEDVRFIQKPGQEPSDVFCLTIPSSAHMQLPALMYYLKQNMLQFLHTPNYVDNKTESRFQDLVCGKWQAIPDGQVYLYIRPQASGSKGIALVYLSLIDGQGNPVKLLSCPKPSRSGFTKVQEEADFESMVQSEIYCPSPSSRPGPTSLIQFRVWERGSADLKTLNEKLISAVKYSLCDIVTEYSMLTAPISQVPQQLQDLLPMPACSEPSSPIAHRGSADSSSLERRHSIVTRKLSEHVKNLSTSGGSKPIERLASPSPLQSLKEAFIPSKTRIMSPPPDSTKTFDIPNVAHASLGQTSAATSPQTQKTDREAEIQQIMAKYESGDRGNLHPVYSKILIDWLDYCLKLGVPSVNKSNLTLRSKFSLDYFLREFQTTVTNISGDVQPKIFKLQKDSSGVLFNGIQYNPFRHPMQVGESHTESSLDYERKCFIGAGRDMHFIVVGRNVDQWQASIQDADEEEFCDSSNPTSPKAIPKHTYQKYRPLSSAAPQDKNTDLIGLLPGSGPIFIPRQRFLLLLLENKQLTLYSYNWAGDLSTLLTKTTKRLTQWNNTRIQLLNSIVSQKMGLFHHNPYEESSQGKDDNPFNSASTELEVLIKQTAPPAREQARRASSMSSLNHPIRPFDAAYKDLIPHKPLHHTPLAIIRDPVAKHGVQALEIRVHDRRDNEKFCKQNNLYWTWLEKTASSIPISDDLIQNLKRSSRLLHYCATPLLFCPTWRQKVMEKYKATQRQVSVTSTSTEKSELKTRSRHSSGTSNASMRTKRADSQDGKKKPSVTPTDSPVNEAKSKSGQEEPWHAELRHSFVNQYIQYVQSLGFVQVQTRPASPKRGSGRHIKKPSSGGQSTHGPTGLIYYLQKTLSAGIMLMEICFREQYFCVQLYTCEHTRLCAPINQQLRLLFVDECEKCKDLIHVHSFAHDFHLRCIQTYISGEQIFKQGYHLTGFLADFMQVYPYPPKFSRNYLHQDVVIETDLPCSGQQLYEFMLQHIKLHQMKVISMVPTVDADIDTEYYFIRANEYAFIHHKLRGEQVAPQKGLKSKGDEHSIGLVIFHDSQSVNFQSEAERNSLKLHYFILLTSRRELFPKAVTEKGGFKSMMQELSDLSQPVPVKQHIGIRPHTSKCMRYPIQESPAYQILMEESHLARQKMKDMVNESKTKCRRDYLWQRMLVGDQAEEDGKRKKRSETEESKDAYLTRLSVEELQSLLDMVVKKPLCDIDKQLMSFYNLSFQWYKSLYKYLLARYPETHRCFSSADGHIQYIIILNPNLLDMFMMLKINHTDHRTELCAVFREAMTEQEHTPQNPSLPVHSMQTHIEDFVSVCCFHLWSSMT